MAVKELAFDADARKALLAGVEKLLGLLRFNALDIHMAVSGGDRVRPKAFLKVNNCSQLRLVSEPPHSRAAADADYWSRIPGNWPKKVGIPGSALGLRS